MRLNLIFGAVLGVVLSISAILIVETLDTSIKDEGDLIDHFTYPIIGIIPNLENPDKSRGYH
ncbi:hypothetical protein SDC9_154131 [bioreactor metagenome]|uniref:Uncharacterized protein n=1 Tax=bioreactor metagenome TaxID=1076179 RepID=A0A645F2Q7_9ZZZZ